ncbi:MAG: hypothetical protein WC325_10650 [Candidatus Bathyarchaeia archaeon]
MSFLGKFTFTAKTWIILIIAIICIIVLIAYGASSFANMKPKSEEQAGLCVVEIRAEIGIKYIIKNNLNTAGGDMIITSLNLPYRFNITKGDTVRFTAITEDDYLFNAWTFNDGTSDNRNALTIKIQDKNFVITANVLYWIPPTSTPLVIE